MGAGAAAEGAAGRSYGGFPPPPPPPPAGEGGGGGLPSRGGRLGCRANSPRHIENSRQTPAYEYPQRYGPKSPSFARGTLLDDTLYVSGTASILGHETVHEGDLDKQWHVAIGNIAHLIGIENLEAQDVSGGYTLRDLDQIKVYYRHAADLPRVMKLAQTAFHADANIRYVKADICRADLLVEIEGIASYRRRSD